jgi:hypothetical protein
MAGSEQGGKNDYHVLNTLAIKFDSKPARLEDVLNTTNAEYTCFWAFSEEKNRLSVAGYYSIDTALMERSRGFSFEAGEDIIGRVWVEKTAQFIKDAVTQDITEFRRQQLAAYHRIKSVSFVPFANGVLEYGTRKLWKESPPWDTKEFKARAVQRRAEETQLQTFNAVEPALQEVVDSSGAEYALFWKVGRVRPPSDRAPRLSRDPRRASAWARAALSRSRCVSPRRAAPPSAPAALPGRRRAQDGVLCDRGQHADA